MVTKSVALTPRARNRWRRHASCILDGPIRLHARGDVGLMQAVRSINGSTACAFGTDSAKLSTRGRE